MTISDRGQKSLGSLPQKASITRCTILNSFGVGIASHSVTALVFAGRFNLSVIPCL